MRAILAVLVTFGLLTFGVGAQAPMEVGTPDSAFAGSPIHLSKSAVGLLRAHYQGDKVPVVPQPFRGRLDAALLGRDWVRLEAAKKELTASQGVVTSLAWEQSRLIATGSIGVAEMHALDVAATGSTGLTESAAMLWLYSVAVTMTDGHKCVDEAAKDAHLDRLRGPAFQSVTQIVRTIPDDRLAAMRDLAIRLEVVLAPDRSDDTMCRSGGGKADVKPDAVWRPEAALTRTMLPKHLVALTSVMRPRPIAGPEPPRREIAKPAPPSAKTATAKVEPTKTEAPTHAEQPKPAEHPNAAATEASRPEPTEPVRAELVDPKMDKPNPTKFEPPNLPLTTPDQQPH
jgi:hypothetical protein